MTASLDSNNFNKEPLRIGRVGAWALMGIVLIASLFPVYWSLRTSLSNNTQLFDEPANVLPPDPTTFNFERVLEIGEISREEIEAAGANDAKFSILRAVLNLGDRRNGNHGLPGVLLCDGGLRLRPVEIQRT